MSACFLDCKLSLVSLYLELGVESRTEAETECRRQPNGNCAKWCNCKAIHSSASSASASGNPGNPGNSGNWQKWLSPVWIGICLWPTTATVLWSQVALRQYWIENCRKLSFPLYPPFLSPSLSLSLAPGQQICTHVSVILWNYVQRTWQTK